MTIVYHQKKMLLTIDKFRNIAILIDETENSCGYHPKILDLDYDTPFSKRQDIPFCVYRT